MKRLCLAVILFASFAQALAAQSTIFLVRHAEKAQDGDSKDPALSAIGQARAQSLATLLKDAGVTDIYATEFKRTQQTAKPLADAVHLEVTVVPAKETAALAHLLKKAPGNALVVAHSNTIPEILKALGISDPPQIDETDYDNLFVLVSGPPAHLLRLHYR